ncbi:MAG: hypothetical protein QNK89_02380 [Lacinutrix sp.]|uniref:hypothetical protein n=1 Tax=Lacinutrix sp. TaxID=1937692 RepID=UPI0030A2ABA3
MKHPFKLSKTNIIYGLIVSFISVFLNTKIRGFNSFSIGYSIGTILTVIAFPTLFALLFWYILGRKENGGTTTFNVVLSILLLSTLGQIGRLSKE